MNFRNAFQNLTLPDGKIIPSTAWQGRGQQSILTPCFGEAATIFLQYILFATGLQWCFQSMASWFYTANMRHDIKCKIGRKTCNCLQMRYASMYNHTESVLPGLWLAFQTLWCFNFLFSLLPGGSCSLIAFTCTAFLCDLPGSLYWWSGLSVFLIALQRESFYTQGVALWMRLKADQSFKSRPIFFLYYLISFLGQLNSFSLLSAVSESCLSNNYSSKLQ